MINNTVTPNETSPKTWLPWRCIGFRFLLIYFVLYTFPFPLDFVPEIGEWCRATVDNGQKAVAVWVGDHILRLDEEMYLGPTGSGDTTVAYVVLLISIVVASMVTAIWSLLVRRRRTAGYPRLAGWLILWCALYLGSRFGNNHVDLWTF